MECENNGERNEARGVEYGGVPPPTGLACVSLLFDLSTYNFLHYPQFFHIRKYVSLFYNNYRYIIHNKIMKMTCVTKLSAPTQLSPFNPNNYKQQDS